MDTVFMVIKDKKNSYYGANHFGYRDKTLKGAYLLLNKLLNKDLDYTFLEANLYQIDGSKEEDIEVLIDLDKKIVILDSDKVREYSLENFLELAENELRANFKNIIE